MKNEFETELKRHTSNNFLLNFILLKFKKDLLLEIKRLRPNKIFDAGCGTGYFLNYFIKNYNVDYSAIDILKENVNHAKKICLNCKVSQASIYELPFKENSFDCSLCSEVIEHLEEPEKAVMELKRVSSKNCIICVPYEPFFTMANFLQLKYLKSWGNYPGHIQHWNKKSFKRLLRKYFPKVKLKSSTFWLIGICEK